MSNSYKIPLYFFTFMFRLLFNKILKCPYTYKRPFIIDKSLLFYQRLHSVVSKALCF